MHLSHDRLRVITVESWLDEGTFRRAGHTGDLVDRSPSSALYWHTATDGTVPTPIADPTAVRS